MHDLLTRQEQLAADQEMESQAEANTPSAEERGPGEAMQGAAVVVPPASILGKRGHSVYEGLSGCEVGGFRKKSVIIA
ncbi:peripheral-type benzodiazepine receptor-associated protein 1 isoform X1 [Arapaima gigas]